jgi:hypothetical protein
MLGVSGAGPPMTCSGETAGFPWRWGLGSPLAPNETRTIHTYVVFRTPGTYTLRASLINEYVKAYGVDGNGTEASAGTVVVLPENRPPMVSRFDGGLYEMASVYQLKPVASGVLARTVYPYAVLEGAYVGAFQWNGTSRDWGAGGPLGQTDRFIIRQSRAFYAPVSGTYAFRLASDDGSWLWVDNTLVAANPGLHGRSAVEATVELAAGLHIVAVKYFDNIGSAYLGYAWRPPGETNWSAIPFVPQSRIGNTWNSPTQMAIVAHDLGGAGLRELRYKYDGGAELSAPNGIAHLGAGPGPHVVEYWGIDHSGAASSIQRIEFVVDPNLQISRRYLGTITR